MIKIQDLCLCVSGFNCTWRARELFGTALCYRLVSLHFLFTRYFIAEFEQGKQEACWRSKVTWRTTPGKNFARKVKRMIDLEAGIRDYPRMLHSVRSNPRVWWTCNAVHETEHSASSNFGFTAEWRDYNRKQNICRSCWPNLQCSRSNLGENVIAEDIKCVSCCIGIRCHFCCLFCLHRLLSLSLRYFHFCTSFTEQGAKTNYMDDDLDRFP